MSFSVKSIGIVAGAAVLSLSMVACHGQSPGGAGYMPTSSTSLSAPQSGSGLAIPDAKHRIASSCGKHINIVLAGIVTCRFREKGYGNGTFTIQNDTNGIVIISPLSGTKATPFTILGAVVGSGYFLVEDSNGNKKRVTVRVSL